MLATPHKPPPPRSPRAVSPLTCCSTAASAPQASVAREPVDLDDDDEDEEAEAAEEPSPGAYPMTAAAFPALSTALGYGDEGPLPPRRLSPSLERMAAARIAQQPHSPRFDVLGSFTDDEPSDDDDASCYATSSGRSSPAEKALILAPSKFGRPAENEDWQADERAVRDAILATASASARAVLDAVPLLFLRLVRGFRLSPNRAAATAAVVEDVCALRGRLAAVDAADIPGDFHARIWPTEVSGVDAHGHLVVVERLGRVDWDALFALPLDVVLRARMDALDCLQAESARRRPGYGRVYKCVFVLDAAGVGYGTLVRSEALALARAYAGLTENMFADAVWKNLVVNAPAMARAAWRVVERALDDETKDSIFFLAGAPGSPDSILRLEDAGLPRSAAPRDLGGSAAAVPLADLLDRRRRGESPAAAAAPPPPVAFSDGGARRPPTGDLAAPVASPPPPPPPPAAAPGKLTIKIALLLFLVLDVAVYWLRRPAAGGDDDPDL